MFAQSGPTFAQSVPNLDPHLPNLGRRLPNVGYYHHTITSRGGDIYVKSNRLEQTNKKTANDHFNYIIPYLMERCNPREICTGWSRPQKAPDHILE